MKGILKLILLSLCSVMLVFSLASCSIQDLAGLLGGNNGGGEGEKEDGEKEDGEKEDGEKDDGEKDDESNDTGAYYTVTLDDGTGKAVTSVQVSLVKDDGTEAAKVIVGMTGEKIKGRADFTAIKSGSYKIVLRALNKADIYYDAENAKIDEDNRSVTVNVSRPVPEKTRVLMGQDIPESANVMAAMLDVGYYFGSFNGDLNYFVFNPSRVGVYEIRFRADDSDVIISNHGIPDYVQPALDTTDEGVIEILVPSISEEGCPRVIGVEPQKFTTGYIEIVRVSDLPNTPEYLPWETVQSTVEIKQFDLPYDNANLVSLDITDENLMVVLGSDGYYHLGDENGKIVYVYISKPVKDGYLDGSFTTIAGLQRIGAYVYDEDGNFVRKESFNDMILEYAACCDKNTGVYPLTEDMAYAIKSFGNAQRWYNLDEEQFTIFGEDSVNIVAENAWLFACATLEDDSSLGVSVENPIELFADGKIKAEAGVNYYFNVMGENITVEIEDAAGVITVYANGETYTANNGIITFTLPIGVTTFYVIASEDMLIEYTSNIA